MEARRVGNAVDLRVERMVRAEVEEQQRNSMGKSSQAKARMLQLLVREARSSAGSGVDLSQADHILAESLLSSRAETKQNWKRDTCLRYLQVGGRLAEPRFSELFNLWEYSEGRGALVDGITVLRACCAAAPTSNELYELLQTLYFEQSCKMRSCVRTRSVRGDKDASCLMRGILLRQRFYDYIRSSFPQFEETTRNYGKWEYFHANKFGLTKGGRVPSLASQRTAGPFFNMGRVP